MMSRLLGNCRRADFLFSLAGSLRTASAVLLATAFIAAIGWRPASATDRFPSYGDKMAVEKYLFPREWGTDQPLTVEGRTQAAQKTPAEILDIVRRWVKQNDQMYEDSRNGKNGWTKDLYDEMDQRLTGYLTDVLATMGITEESMMRDYQKAMEEKEKAKEAAFEQTKEKTKQAQIDAEAKLAALTEVAKQGNMTDFDTLAKAIGEGLGAERGCQLLPVCDPERDALKAAMEIFDQWAEAFSTKCKAQKGKFDTVFVFGLERQRQLFGLGAGENDNETLSESQKADLARRVALSNRLMDDCAFPDPNWPSQLSGTITIKGSSEINEAEEKPLKHVRLDGSVYMTNTTYRLQGNSQFEWTYKVTNFVLADDNDKKMYALFGRITRSSSGSCSAILESTGQCTTTTTTTGNFTSGKVDDNVAISVRFSGVGNREFSILIPFSAGAVGEVTAVRQGCDQSIPPERKDYGHLRFGQKGSGLVLKGLVDENGKINSTIAIEGEDMIHADIACNSHLAKPAFPVSATVEIKLQ